MNYIFLTFCKQNCIGDKLLGRNSFVVTYNWPENVIHGNFHVCNTMHMHVLHKLFSTHNTKISCYKTFAVFIKLWKQQNFSPLNYSYIAIVWRQINIQSFSKLIQYTVILKVNPKVSKYPLIPYMGKLLRYFTWQQIFLANYGLVNQHCKSTELLQRMFLQWKFYCE